MQLTRGLIEGNLRTHSEFEEHLLQVEEIEQNVDEKPDIAIESAKSLIGGVSRTIKLENPKKIACELSLTAFFI